MHSRQNVRAIPCQHAWTIPDDTVARIISADNYYFRVAEPDDVTDETISVSTNRFQIIGDLDLTMLNGGSDENYQVGDTPSITWNKFGQANAVPDPDLFDDFDLEYSNDGFASDTRTIQNVLSSAVCTGSSCTYGWNILDTETLSASAVYTLRVRDPDNTLSNDLSVRKFRIAGNIDLTILDSAVDTYAVGDPISITFTKDGNENGSIFDNVKVQYSIDDFSSDIRAVLPGGVDDIFDITDTGGLCPLKLCTVTWTVPNTVALTGSPAYKFRVFDPQNSDLTGYTYSADLSAFEFKLRGSFTMGGGDHPQASDTWAVADVENVSWVTSGLMNDVRIAYSTDNFLSRAFVYYNSGNLRLEDDPGAPATFALAQNITNTPNGAQNYDWFIPDAISSNVKMRIYDANDESVYIETAAFKIHSYISGVTPGSSASEVYAAGETGVNLSWTTTGTVPGILLEYSLDNQGSWAPIPPAQSGSVTNASGEIVGNPGSITWTMPQVKTGNIFQAYARVTWLDGSQIPDTDSSALSANPFKLSANITVIAPNAENAPLWKVGGNKPRYYLVYSPGLTWRFRSG